MLRASPAALLAVVVAACGAHSTGHQGTTPDPIRLPERVTEDTYEEFARLYTGVPLDHPDRIRLRGRLLAHLETLTPALLEASDYEEVVDHFARMTALLLPEDYEEGRVPQELDAPARFIHAHGSPPGDEARVMSALAVLGVLHPDEARFAREYTEVMEWGRDARGTLPSAVESWSKLIEVWEEHARLTPMPNVLNTLARLHVERRDAMVALLHGEGVDEDFPIRLQALSPQLIRRAPLDVAAVFLEQGDLASAITHVEAMGDVGGTEERLLHVLREGQDGGEAGNDAILELAELFRAARPPVSRGLCVLGHRQTPDEPRFPLCLARVAAAEERYVDATGWYATAIELAPEDRGVYDEALEQLDEFIGEGLFASDAGTARSIARHAEQILEARQQRWPTSEPALPRQRLQYLMGELEMNAGNAAEARRWFAASIESGEEPDALVQLGVLVEGSGEPNEAIRLYRRALDLTPERERQDMVNRAGILEHLGDAYAAGSDEVQARRMYQLALGLWDQVLPSLEGAGQALVHVRRGVLLHDVGRGDDALAAFRAAMATSPDIRQPYELILRHLVSSQPDLELAVEVFRRAQRELTLEPEWKVYFALWVKAVAGRAGVAAPTEVAELLDQLGESPAWWGRLARFGNGRLGYDELLHEASNPGQQTEAHFYEGARLMAAGDAENAARLFERVIQTNMVNFHEFIMARALVTPLRASLPPPRSSTP